MSIYVLIATLVNTSNGVKTIDVQTMAFTDPARCIRNAEINKRELNRLYEQVSISCQEKKLIPKQ